MIVGTSALRDIPLFAASSDRSLEIIASIAHETSYPAGAELVREGEVGDSLIIIRRGTATVRQAGRELPRLEAGDFLGEIALIDGGRRTATVTAAEPIEALVIGREGFAQLMEEVPVIRYELISALTRRLRARGVEPTD
ncbi:MAG TPA: cyclic nucleotide-binding domain-containing protein [Candidatus Limnocylindrales bacterium]|nr:cyclic nucleotide-binding domain-containing protein [Candidatus Limnocylindrales bacterium]